MPQLCCRAICNTDYEGEIQNQGDRVKIRTKPTITIRDYLADGLLGLDRPSGGQVELYIGIGKYFSLILDDVMEVQSDLNLLQHVVRRCGPAAQDRGRPRCARRHRWSAPPPRTRVIPPASSPATSTSARRARRSHWCINPVPGTSVGILDAILRLGQALDEQNIPEQGRWVVMSAAAGRYIKQSELRQAYLSGDPVSVCCGTEDLAWSTGSQFTSATCFPVVHLQTPSNFRCW